ncbi:Hypothetical protein D9617_24g016420 [Elsinoe fawcettii]|nr:Hypothetical protein D9617_24g016420 [Elsinoe fawcettii]
MNGSNVKRDASAQLEGDGIKLKRRKISQQGKSLTTHAAISSEGKLGEVLPSWEEKHHSLRPHDTNLGVVMPHPNGDAYTAVLQAKVASGKFSILELAPLLILAGFWSNPGVIGHTKDMIRKHFKEYAYDPDSRMYTKADFESFYQHVYETQSVECNKLTVPFYAILDAFPEVSCSQYLVLALHYRVPRPEAFSVAATLWKDKEDKTTLKTDIVQSILWAEDASIESVNKIRGYDGKDKH